MWLPPSGSRPYQVFIAGVFRVVTSHDRVLEVIEGAPLEGPSTELIHEQAMTLYREFLAIGGMPEAVKLWKDSQRKISSFSQVRTTQQTLLLRFKSDFSKYFGRESLNISKTLKVAAEQLASNLQQVNRFRFKDALSGKRSFSAFENIFHALEATRMIHRCHVLAHPLYPLNSQKKEAFFKCYYADTGLLLAEMNFDLAALAKKSEIPFKGPVAENFVATEFVKAGVGLFCYQKQNSQAEIEFLLQNQDSVVPVEVKNNHVRA